MVKMIIQYDIFRTRWYQWICYNNSIMNALVDCCVVFLHISMRIYHWWQEHVSEMIHLLFTWSLILIHIVTSPLLTYLFSLYKRKSVFQIFSLNVLTISSCLSALTKYHLRCVVSCRVLCVRNCAPLSLSHSFTPLEFFSLTCWKGQLLYWLLNKQDCSQDTDWVINEASNN